MVISVENIFTPIVTPQFFSECREAISRIFGQGNGEKKKGGALLPPPLVYNNVESFPQSELPPLSALPAGNTQLTKPMDWE